MTFYAPYGLLSNNAVNKVYLYSSFYGCLVLLSGPQQNLDNSLHMPG